MSTNNIEIDVINDEEIWDTYMKKQEYLMKTKLDNDKADKMNKKVVHQSKSDPKLFKTLNDYYEES